MRIHVHGPSAGPVHTTLYSKQVGGKRRRQRQQQDTPRPAHATGIHCPRDAIRIARRAGPIW